MRQPLHRLLPREWTADPISDLRLKRLYAEAESIHPAGDRRIHFFIRHIRKARLHRDLHILHQGEDRADPFQDPFDILRQQDPRRPTTEENRADVRTREVRPAGERIYLPAEELCILVLFPLIRLLFEKCTIRAGKPAKRHMDVHSRFLSRNSRLPNIFHERRQLQRRHHRRITCRERFILPLDIPSRATRPAARSIHRLPVHRLYILLIRNHRCPPYTTSAI